MYEVNRSVILIVPKMPFWLWVQSLQDSEADQFTLEDMLADPNAYLIEACEDIDEAWEQVEERIEDIFSAELADWSEDDQSWPDLHIDIFSEWFELKLSTIVTDLSHQDLDREAFEAIVLDA